MKNKKYDLGEFTLGVKVPKVEPGQSREKVVDGAIR